MIVGGLVAEYDPFHLGHAGMLAAMREEGITHIVAVMSGSFTQRADAALCDKWTRAEMALAGGVDLVLELPVAFAAAPAPRFAAGGVGTLAALGCVERLCFGSECGDAARLEAAAAVMRGEAFAAALRRGLESGASFAAAQQAALTAAGGEGELLSHPNDTLALAYLAANDALETPMTPLAVRRAGASHDGEPADGIASASWIRARVRTGEEEAALPFLPEESRRLLKRETEAGRCPADLGRLETAVLAALHPVPVFSESVSPSTVAMAVRFNHTLDSYQPEKDHYRFYFTYKTVHPWWDAVAMGMEEAQRQFLDRGITVTYEYLAPEQASAKDQIRSG